MNARIFALAAMITMIIASVSLHFVTADPTGASITSNETAGTPTSPAGSRNDSRGTITTLVLNTVQQNNNWKAYVGNITGKLSLDDASGNTIYDWALGSVNKSGEVYVSRYNAITWTNVSCINSTLLANESTYFGMSPAQSDSVGNTYNYTNHAAIPNLALGISIGTNTCRSTATYRNDAVQTIDGSQEFQALILQDNSTSRVIYVAIVNNSYNGFDTRSYDFQIIVPESLSQQTVYYFYTRLTG